MLRPRAIAQRLRQTAEALFSLADEIDAMEPTTIGRSSPRARIASVVAQIAADVARGLDEGTATALAARNAGVSLSDAAGAWKISQRRRDTAELYARRYMARQLNAQGIDRQTIADLIGCHPNHVPRMIAALDHGRAARPAANERTAEAGGGRASLDRPPPASPVTPEVPGIDRARPAPQAPDQKGPPLREAPCKEPEKIGQDSIPAVLT